MSEEAPWEKAEKRIRRKWLIDQSNRFKKQGGGISIISFTQHQSKEEKT
jgi:hypothetical protein